MGQGQYVSLIHMPFRKIDNFIYYFSESHLYKWHMLELSQVIAWTGYIKSISQNFSEKKIKFPSINPPLGYCRTMSDGKWFQEQTIYFSPVSQSQNLFALYMWHCVSNPIPHWSCHAIRQYQWPPWTT